MERRVDERFSIFLKRIGDSSHFGVYVCLPTLLSQFFSWKEYIINNQTWCVTWLIIRWKKRGKADVIAEIFFQHCFFFFFLFLDHCFQLTYNNHNITGHKEIDFPAHSPSSSYHLRLSRNKCSPRVIHHASPCQLRSANHPRRGNNPAWAATQCLPRSLLGTHR